MNPKQCKRIRKQLGYKPQNLAGSLSEDQQKLKKEYKNKKRSYKTASQVKQLAFEARCAERKAKALAEQNQADADLLASRNAARAARRAAKVVEVNPLVVAGAERKRKHAERQAVLEASENAFRKNLRRQEMLALQAEEKVRLEKKNARLAVALKNSEPVVDGQSA